MLLNAIYGWVYMKYNTKLIHSHGGKNDLKEHCKKAAENVIIVSYCEYFAAMTE